MADTRRRQRELERQKLVRRQQREVQRRAQRRRFALIGVVALVILGVIGGGVYAAVSGGRSKPSTSHASAASKICGPAPNAKPLSLHFPSEPPLTISRTAYTATLQTNCGTITLRLDGAKAPHTVNSFAFLAGKKYFDNTPCPRIVDGQGLFVLQCGDPTGQGTGGPGYTIPDENLSGATYPAGTVAMANTGQPHTGGSQFFLVFKDSQLPPQYTPFGTITSGLGILQKIAAAGNDGSNPAGGGHPKVPVYLTHVTVTKAA